MKSARLLLLMLLVAVNSYAANPLRPIKAQDEDDAGSSVLAALNACQPLAPAPFGSFVPADVVLAVPGQTTTTPPITFTVNGPLPGTVTIPRQTIGIPANT